MKYKDIFEFRRYNPTKELMMRELALMSEEEFKELVSTSGVVQRKIYYSRLYKESKKKYMN